ncbi:MAG: chemoreceptor glutamine deamidase CheD [Candidatus Rifleibacteriota bacterium]
MTTYVGIGEYFVSGQPDAVIKTMALGPCVGVAVFSKDAKIAGLLHVQLPLSTTNPELAARRPGAFADTGIPLLLEEFARCGCRPSDLVVKIVGGSQVMDPAGTFNIGKRNYLAVKKILWAFRLWPVAEEIGGNISRTVTISVGSTDVLITTPGMETRKI